MSIMYSLTSHHASLLTLGSSGESGYLSQLLERERLREQSIESLKTKLPIIGLSPTRIQRREQLIKEMEELETHRRSQGIVTCL